MVRVFLFLGVMNKPILVCRVFDRWRKVPLKRVYLAFPDLTPGLFHAVGGEGNLSVQS